MSNQRKIVAAVVAAVVVLGGLFGFSALGGDSDDSADVSAELGAGDEQAEVDDSSAADNPSSDGAAASDDGVNRNEDGEEIPEVVIGQDEEGEDLTITLEVTEFCGTTRHTELAGYPSHIEYLIAAPGLENGTEVELQADGVNDGRVWTATVEDHTIVAKGGVRSYGEYALPTVTWSTGEDTSSSITSQDKHVVDDDEGVLDCNDVAEE